MGNKFSFSDFTKTANDASNIVVNAHETLTRQDIQTKYQTHLINAANNMNNDVRKLASVRLYCINKLEWEKTKFNFRYIILLIIILIGLLLLYIFGKIDIYIYIFISILITISWCILYTFYKKKKLIEWNTILYKINTNPLNIKDITDNESEDITKTMDKLYEILLSYKNNI